VPVVYFLVDFFNILVKAWLAVSDFFSVGFKSKITKYILQELKSKILLTVTVKNCLKSIAL